MQEVIAEKFETFTYYINERESIRQKKESLLPKPWTEDPILQNYKFTNVLREDDRTSKWVIENWYRPNHNKDLRMQFLNCAIFRYFGTVEFAKEVGWQETWNPDELVSITTKMLQEGKKVFTGAYIITNAGHKLPKQEVVVYKFLQPLTEELERIIEIAQKTNSWEAVYNEFVKLMGMGPFMAKEILQDVMFTPILENCTDRFTFSPAGPGAIRGLNRLYGRPIKKPLSQKIALQEMQDLYFLTKARFKDHLNNDRIKNKWDLHALQFSLCEFDKYERVKNNQGRPRSKYNGV